MRPGAHGGQPPATLLKECRIPRDILENQRGGDFRFDKFLRGCGRKKGADGDVSALFIEAFARDYMREATFSQFTSLSRKFDR